MADCSLDDYIKQKGIGVNVKKRITVGNPDGGTNAQFLPSNGNKVQKLNRLPVTKLQQTVDARRYLSNPAPKQTGIASRLSGIKIANKDAAVQNVVSLSKSAGAISDARQKILAKTKFGDARQRILTKKIQKETGMQPAPTFDVRRKLEARRANSLPQIPKLMTPNQIPMLMNSNPVTLFSGDELQSTGWDASPVSAFHQGVANFGGNIVRTVHNSPQAASNPRLGIKSATFTAPPLMSDFSNPQILQNDAKITITMKNDQHSINAVSQRKQLLQPTSRIPANSMIDEQPIQTVISQPPVKLVSKPTIVPASTPAKTQSTAAKLQQQEVETATHSPLQGFRIKVSNLHPKVSHEDIIELFGAIGALKRACLLKPGQAEVTYVNRDDALMAITKYDMRELDGQPMSLVLEDRKPAPAAASKAASLGPQHQPLRLKKEHTSQVIELEPGILHKALFKTPLDQTPVKPVSFTVHM